jgi:pimeloyl-ACP methyl ester carboxylesterase
VSDLFAAEQPGPPGSARVVFVHGALDRSTAFAPTSRRLGDLTLVRYDRRGYGRSLACGVCTDLDEQVADLAGVVAERPTVLVGHSLGGVLAVTLAARRPDLIEAVVAYEAPMAWASWWPVSTAGGAAVAGDPAQAAERFMRRLIGDERWAALPERTRAARRAEGPALLAELRSMRASPDAPYDAATLRVPVLAAHGTESRAHHKAAAERLAAAAPQGQLRVIEGAGHGAHLTHPDAFAGLVRAAVAARADGTLAP